MKNIVLIKQTASDKMWQDESGNNIPVGRVTQGEKLREKHSHKIAKTALDIHFRLHEFKSMVRELCDEVYLQSMEASGVDPKSSKGNFTWFNFDRSIKIEIAISDRIEFDDLLVAASKEKFDDFINRDIESKSGLGKELVNDVFSTRKGKLDVKKVFDFFKYESRIPDEAFQAGIKLLKDSIRRPDSRTYFRVWIRDENGKYNIVDLNFSSI